MSSLQEIINKINQTGPIQVEELSAGTIALIAIAGATILQNIVESKQQQCVINELKDWTRKYGFITDTILPPKHRPSAGGVPPAEYETVRPAISMAYGVYNNEIPLPDLFGHGIVVKTKYESPQEGDVDILLYLGRIDPNWYQIQVAQGGSATTAYIGKMFRSKIVNAVQEQFKRLQEYILMSAGYSKIPSSIKLAIAQFGAISLGKVDDIFSDFVKKYNRPYPWVNPIHMQYCQANTWYGNVASWFMNALNQIFTQKARAVNIPLYTGKLLSALSWVNVKSWGEDKRHGKNMYSSPPGAFINELIEISKQIAQLYLSIATAFGPLPKYTPLAIPATSIGYDIKTRYDLPYSIYDILKVGIGAPVQSSFWCGDSCSQYGNLAQIVGVGAMSPIVPYNQAAYFALPHPDYDKMTALDIVNYWDQILGIGDAIKFSIIASLILDAVYEEIKKKYGDEIAKFARSWTPYTDNQSEAQQTAEEIAQRGLKIVEKAKEIIQTKIGASAQQMQQVMPYIYECLKQKADPYGNLDEEAKKVADCAAIEYLTHLAESLF